MQLIMLFSRTVKPAIGILQITCIVLIGITCKMELNSAKNPVYFKNSLLFGQDHHDLNKQNTTLTHMFKLYFAQMSGNEMGSDLTLR